MFSFRSPNFTRWLVIFFGIAAIARAAAAPEIGPFFEPEQPVFGSQVQLAPPPKGEIAGGNFVVRGLVLPLGSGQCLVFDQELLRVAGVWAVPPGATPITLTTMAQISYASLRRKAGNEHPRPTGPLLLVGAMHPGVGANLEALFSDPRRPASAGDIGRGALPENIGRFESIELAGATAVLHYRSGTTEIREWHEAQSSGKIFRHFNVGPHATALHIAIGNSGDAATERWTLSGKRVAAAGEVISVVSNSDALTLAIERGELVAMLAPSNRAQEVSLALIPGLPPATTEIPATPALPKKKAGLRWPGIASAAAQLDALQQDGLILDRIALPLDNPWKRHIRPADLAFLTDDRAAVVTYDGDVWLVDGFNDPKLARLTWRRFASGLHEPLAITAPGGVVQVATKNGVIRLHDRDGDGEADWFENFNDQLIQSQTTRSFPLDMAMGPDGSTFITQGGIVQRSGMPAGGEGTIHTGAVFKISPDGHHGEAVSTGAREPYVTVHPKTGVITGTDQQGHYIPASACYLIRPGDHFGFPELQPKKLTPPLVWVPHEEDSSSSSEVWAIGAGMGPYDGKLLHLSYGTGRLFIITPDLEAVTPQGAVIPLDLKTDLPLLHARMNLRGNALYLAGFQIYGARSTINWGLGRLRRGATPVTTAIAARSVADGVVIEFAEPLDPASLQPQKVAVRAWNYKRSAAYGSGRYALDGAAGTTPWPIGQVVLSNDHKAVFVHLPKLPAVQQLELRHDFRLANGAVAAGVIYFTIHQPHAVDLAQLGFPPIDLSKSVAVVTLTKEEPPTVALGKALSESLGCIACHSSDGTTEGKVGPTWRRLYGSKLTFIDGTTEVADEFYLREKILDPQQKKIKPGQIEMPSYRGVLSQNQLDAIVLYIKSLAGRRGPADDGEK